MNTKANIREDIARITAGISSDRYPILSGCLENKASSLKAHLLFMLQYMEGKTANTTYGGESYWIIPKDGMKAEHGGSGRTWQSHLVFLSLTGLLERVKPNSQTKNKVMAAAYARALEERKAPAIFYTARLYTVALLSYAEAQARRFRERGISLSDIRKTDIIALYGPAMANSFYQDQRTISAEDEEAAQLILNAIGEQITARGYALRAEAIRTAKQGAEERENRITLTRKINHQAAQITALCQDHGLSYHRVGREDHSRHGLPYGAKIITATEYNSPVSTEKK